MYNMDQYGQTHLYIDTVDIGALFKTFCRPLYWLVDRDSPHGMYNLQASGLYNLYNIN